MAIAMITGGASWFSRATARLLLADGWDIALSDINAATLAEVVAELDAPGRVSSGLLDVADLAAVGRYVADVAGKGQIGALINVAGGSNYLQIERRAFHETTPDYWDKILRPNLYGVMHTCHAVVPHMIAARRGVIVNISSGLGLKGAARMATYSAAKAAVIAFTQSIAQELGPHGIRANCVAPGSAESRWQPELKPLAAQRQPPLGRRTTAEDIANAIAFLVSDRASNITGSCLDVSGGAALH